MIKYNSILRDRIISILLRHTENVWRKGRDGEHLRETFSDEDIAILINELQVYQNELEIQNDELIVAKRLLEETKLRLLRDIAERERWEREAERAKIEQQRAVLSATLNAQEKERNKLSHALHDSVCQLLYGIRLNLQNIPELRGLTNELKGVNQLLDQAIRETRQISYELTPSVLKDFGFIAGIKEMAQRLSTYSFTIKTHIGSSIDELDPSIQLYAFRIVQELINNCIKHAHADLVKITVGMRNQLVSISVADNGRGFKNGLNESLSKGSGLRAIKNQVFLLKGKMKFDISDKGTKITITFDKDVELLLS